MIEERFGSLHSICKDCGEKWNAVFPVSALDIYCPKCESDNTVRDFGDLSNMDESLCLECQAVLPCTGRGLCVALERKSSSI